MCVDKLTSLTIAATCSWSTILLLATSVYVVTDYIPQCNTIQLRGGGSSFTLVRQIVKHAQL